MRQALPLTAFIACCVLFAGAAAAAGEPEDAFAQYHRAVFAGDLPELLRHVPAAQRKRLEAMPAAQKSAEIQMLATMLPHRFALRTKTPLPGGQSARLVVGGPDPSGKQQPIYGTVIMLKEIGQWKVGVTNWSTVPPSASAQVPPGSAQAPQKTGAKAGPAAPAVPARASPNAPPVVGSTTGAPVRKLGTAKPPCVFKSVMTAEDLANCK